MQRFALTKTHMKLIAEMCVGWCDDEYGAPEIDPKRPYGNSDVPSDIREIVGDDSMSDDEARRLHAETKVALQIALRTQSFTPGEYECDDYSNNWALKK